MTIFDLVEAYAEIGIHRTGTPTQALTAEWLAEELAARGGQVSVEPVEFERYVADWSVTIDGVEVEALPLFYEAVGAVSTDDPTRWPAFDPPGSGPMGASGAMSDGAPGTVAVAATRNLLGLLAVSNRSPVLGSGQHVLQVAGHYGEALAEGAAVTASIDARLESAACPNVVAKFGAVDGAERLVIVTTPISGWFRCAGERGTGIAAALEMAERLAHDRPVLFLGATGHELNAFGAAVLHNTYSSSVDTLVHVGANVGCDWASTSDLSGPDHSLMRARLVSDRADISGIAAPFEAIGSGVDEPGRDRSKWFGEAAEWLDAPQVLSFLGQNPWFHAPQDVSSVSCTGARTQTVATALTEAALQLIAR